MKIAAFRINGRDRIGVDLGGDHLLALEGLIPRTERAGPNGSEADLSLADIVEAGETSVAAIERLAQEAKAGAHGAQIFALGDVTLRPPVPRLRKNIFCVGRNYREHVAEGYRSRGEEAKYPAHPQFFTKPPTTVIAHGEPIPLHAATAKLDYEVELGLVIGRAGRDIAEEDALDHVFGYTIINDITARDLQRRHDQWFKGKSLDGSCPIGPWLVPRGAIGDPQKLDIVLTVNGEERQRSNTANMIFPIARIIAELSQGLTLEPGDIIATGTPSGVGYAMTPPHFLQPGDVVSCSIERIGTLTNRVM